MVGIEHANNEEVKVLLKPDDVALRSVEDLDDARIGEDDAHLVPHGLSDLGHEKVDDKVSSRRRSDLHEGQEAGKGTVGVVFEIDGDDGACSEVGDELSELGEGGNVGERSLGEGFGRGRRWGLSRREEERRVGKVRELVVIRVRRDKRRSRAGRPGRDWGRGEGRRRRRLDVRQRDKSVVLDEGRSWGGGVDFVLRSGRGIIRWGEEQELRLRDGSVGDGLGETSADSGGTSWVWVDGFVLRGEARGVSIF
jgi:hypothetical protein